MSLSLSLSLSLLLLLSFLSLSIGLTYGSKHDDHNTVLRYDVCSYLPASRIGGVMVPDM